MEEARRRIYRHAGERVDRGGRRSMGRPRRFFLSGCGRDGGISRRHAFFGRRRIGNSGIAASAMIGTPTKKKSWSQDQIRRRVSELGEWFHNLNLNGVQTAPDHFQIVKPLSKFRYTPPDLILR